MMETNVEQLKFMESTAKARLRASELAKEADRLKLMTLAREWDYLGHCLEKAIANQLRVFQEAELEPEEQSNDR